MTTDAMLARIARRALLISAVLAALALVIGGADGLAAATGVVGGAALAIMSFLLLRRGTARMADPASPGVRTGLGLVLVRYALLGVAAYVMVAHLRLHPIGLIAGASSVALAITFEAFTHRS